MKKTVICILLSIMTAVLAFSALGCDEPSESPKATISGFEISVDGKVSFDTKENTVYYLYKGDNRLVEILNGDDITGLITEEKASYTVRTDNETSAAVNVYKPSSISSLEITGTVINFNAQTGVVYKLSINGESVGEVINGEDIKSKLGVGVYSVYVYSDGKIEKDTVQLNARSNEVIVNTEGDNDIDYDSSWLS